MRKRDFSLFRARWWAAPRVSPLGVPAPLVCRSFLCARCAFFVCSTAARWLRFALSRLLLRALRLLFRLAFRVCFRDLDFEICSSRLVRVRFVLWNFLFEIFV